MAIEEGTYSLKRNIRQGFPSENYWRSYASEGAEANMELHTQNDLDKFIEYLKL